MEGTLHCTLCPDHAQHIRPEINPVIELFVGVALSALALNKSYKLYLGGALPGLAWGIWSGHRASFPSHSCGMGVLDQLAHDSLPPTVSFLIAGLILASHIDHHLIPHSKVFVPLVGAAVGRRIGRVIGSCCVAQNGEGQGASAPQGD